MRYRYIAYKYSRRGRSDPSFQSLWDSFGSWPGQSTMVWKPPTDIYETPEHFIILIELAGVPEDNMNVTLFSDLLVVEGTREQAALVNMNACHQLGIKYGDFRAEIALHTPVDHDHVRAEYKNGLLVITLLKR